MNNLFDQRNRRVNQIRCQRLQHRQRKYMTRLTITNPINRRDHITRLKTNNNSNRRRSRQRGIFKNKLTNFSMIIPRILILTRTKTRQSRLNTISSQTTTSNRSRTRPILPGRIRTFRSLVRSQIQNRTKRFSSLITNLTRHNHRVIVNTITLSQTTTMSRRRNTKT